jgi:hypothetical protein
MAPVDLHSFDDEGAGGAGEAAITTGVSTARWMPLAVCRYTRLVTKSKTI